MNQMDALVEGFGWIGMLIGTMWFFLRCHEVRSRWH